MIANSQRAEITKLLAALKDLPGMDNKTINLRRRAKNAVRKLDKAKQISNGK
ncbi:MAG: hypothetical protein NTZ69_15850 [Bacteroidia bacterium]|nr:hypothetical protein [Bacteroidia bacterium]